MRAGVIVVGLVAAVGCGRLGFDARGSDGSTGDEGGAGDDVRPDGLPPDLSSVLFAWYPLDEDITVASMARDISGHGRTARCPVGLCPTRDVGRTGGFAARFDGNNHFVRWTPSSTEADLPTFTVTAWVKPERRPPDFEMVVTRPILNSSANSWALDHSSGGFLEYYSQGGNSVFSSQTIALGAWTHLAIVFDSPTKLVYIGGALNGSGGATGVLGYDASPLMIGADVTVGIIDHYFRGQIADVMIFTRPLTQGEILSLAQ